MTTIDKHTIATLRALSEQCADTECQAAMAPKTLTAVLDRLEKAEAKLAAIGRLRPTDYADREQLLGALFRILHSDLAELQEDQACTST